MRATLPLLALAVLAGCDRDAMYREQSFTESVAKAYEECNASEIRFLAGKHNLQTAFENCGSNDFVSFSWAPDGVQLYFQLPLTANLMNAETKTIQPLPVEQPIANATWLGQDLLVVPMAPVEGSEKPRLALYNRAQNTLENIEVALTEPRDFQPSGTRDAVLLLGTDDSGRRTVFSVSFNDSKATPAWSWLERVPDGFTYSPEQDIAAIAVGRVVTLYKGATGEKLRAFTDATRASVHPDGRYIALETLGEPISPFDQRSWNELSPEAREREVRRREAWLERQPDWVPKSQAPPVIDIWDNEISKRVRFNGFYGDRFQWYPGPPIFASFVMWGIEGKEFNKNVALTNLAERLRLVANGEIPLGMEAWPGQTESKGTPTPPSE